MRASVDFGLLIGILAIAICAGVAGYLGADKDSARSCLTKHEVELDGIVFECRMKGGQVVAK